MQMPPLEFAYQLACMPFNAREGSGCPKDQIWAKICGEVWKSLEGLGGVSVRCEPYCEIALIGFSRLVGAILERITVLLGIGPRK